MPAITQYDGDALRALSETSGMSIEHIREIIDEFNGDDNAVRNRIQVEMFERDAIGMQWRRAS